MFYGFIHLLFTIMLWSPLLFYLQVKGGKTEVWLTPGILVHGPHVVLAHYRPAREVSALVSHKRLILGGGIFSCSSTLKDSSEKPVAGKTGALQGPAPATLSSVHLFPHLFFLYVRGVTRD